MAKRNVSAAIVREWAKDNLSSISEEGHLSLTGRNGVVRGRLHPKVIEAFNRANKSQKYDPSVKTPNEKTLIKRTIMVESKSGRKTPRTVTLTADEVRTLTKTEGTVGRIPDALKDAAAFAKVKASA